MTKPENCVIIIKLSDESTNERQPTKINQKFFEKSFEKHLTNETKCGIINELANEPDGSQRAQERTTTEKFEKSFSKKLKKDLTND